MVKCEVGDQIGGVQETNKHGTSSHHIILYYVVVFVYVFRGADLGSMQALCLCHNSYDVFEVEMDMGDTI